MPTFKKARLLKWKRKQRRHNMKSLQLHKCDVKNIKPEISEALIEELEGVLTNIDNLSKENVEAVIRFQDNDGGFRPFIGRWIYDSDAYKRVANYTSFLCICILINADMNEVADVNSKVFDLAFNYVERHGMAGHGYDAEIDEVHNLSFFLNNGLKEFFKKHSPEHKSFEAYVTSLVNKYRDTLASGNTTVGFGVDIRKDIEKMLDVFDHTYYIAYGSNLNKEQMERRCPGSKSVQCLLLRNRRLDFNLYLTVSYDANFNTPVVIWKISEDNERNLDGYEGVARGIYRKEYIRLFVSGAYRYCLLYIMNDIPNRRNVLPLETYVKTCMIGYDNFGFNKEYLEDALYRAKHNYSGEQ